MSNQQAIASFIEARECFLARRFAEAREAMQRYRKIIDYQQFGRTDNRSETKPEVSKPEVSVIIVTYNTGADLLDCLKSVFVQRGPPFEVILVDNGANESIHSQLGKQPLLWIRPPLNLLPSEGRNLGAHFAKGNQLIFLDDDALMAPGYIAEVSLAMRVPKRVALRGRVVPKSANPVGQPPKHYDPGEQSQPCQLNLEGNMTIRKSAFLLIGGFDPLLFGHEGKEMGQRLQGRFPDCTIDYQPTVIIRHDYAAADKLDAKRGRQALANDYLQYVKEQTLRPGVSIVVRAGQDLSAPKSFLDSLVKHNSYRPIEVAVIALDAKEAIAIARPYLAHFLVRVLPTTVSTLGKLVGKLRYDQVLLIDPPAAVQADVLPIWLKHQQTEQAGAMLCKREQLASHGDIASNTPLEQLTARLDKHLQSQIALQTPARKTVTGNAPKFTQKSLPSFNPAAVTAQAPQPASTTAKGKVAGTPDNPVPGVKEVEQSIQCTETRLSQADQHIAEIENRYLALPEGHPDKQSLEDQLEERVLASCRLLIELKDAQDALQELRVRSLCAA
ncbi:glycosyltransferase [Accumulibacter sp.]|uniref:glycosyltransferase family 2 protein n=1 Tax=Accumulibacter sp. TaxID=2053492 RepID=UPI002634601B|nr:glycosyltransferase [Accumulibacter sp.]